MKNLLSVLCSLTLLGFSPVARAVVTITVTSTADNGPGSLRSAIATAAPGSIINFAVTGVISLTNGELLINKDLTISGPGPANLSVQRSTAVSTPGFRVFHISAGTVSISGLGVSHGRDVAGGGVLNEASLTLSNLVVNGNVATNMLGLDGLGGGINNSGTLEISDSTISTNSADGGSFNGSGGGIYNTASLTLLSSTINGNSANGANGGLGGGIYNFASITAERSQIGGNTAVGNPGLMGAPAQGGGIYNLGTIRLLFSSILENSALAGNGSTGGGEGRGGGIFNSPGCTTYLDQSTLSGNRALGGSSSEGNAGAAEGGAFVNDSGTVRSSQTTISGNSAIGGNGLRLGFGGLAHGGGVRNIFGDLLFTNSTISGNLVAGGTGVTTGENHGGAFSTDFGVITLFDMTIVSNAVAIFASDDGGGFFNMDGAVEIKNSILAGNTASVDLFNSPASAFGSDGFNLIGTTNGPVAPGPNDQFNISGAALKIGPLQDNGGPTFTHALFCGSPAINAGDNTDAPATDQRGFGRIVDGVIDIGAFESAITGAGALTIAKSCPANQVRPGGLLVFSGTVSNAGSSVLTNITVLNDQPQPNTLVTNIALLNPGQALTFSGSYVVPADFTNCAIADTLIASGMDPCSEVPVTATNLATCIIQHTLVLVCPDNLTLECPDDAPPPDPGSIIVRSTAAGARAALLSEARQTNGCTVTIKRTYSAVDSCGDSNFCTQTITVSDTVPPDVVCALDKTVECGTRWSFDPPAAVDACSGTNVIIGIMGTQTNTSGFCGNTFRATRTWRATDSCSNSSICSQTVTVVDTSPPSLACSPNQTVEYGSVWAFSPPTAADACDGTNVNIQVVSTRTNTTGFCGNTFSATRTWAATDSCSNTMTCSQTITVRDTTPPTLSCGAAQVVECGVTWDFSTPAVNDNADGTNVTLRILRTETNRLESCGNTFVATRFWEATDRCTNRSECSQTVTVVDTTPPVVTNVPPGEVVYQCPDQDIVPQPGAIDACDGNNLIRTAISGIAIDGCGFVISRSWTFTDGCSNSVTVGQTVRIKDTTPPEISCGNNRTVECGTVWNFAMPNVSDNCSTNVTLVVVSTTTNQGSLCGNGISATRTWEATDQCTNRARCSQTITVVDTTPPDLVCSNAKKVSCGTAWSFDPPIARDACDGTNVTIRIATTTTNRSSVCGSAFTAVRTWEAYDSCSNISSCSQAVMVVDTNAPVLTCSPELIVECGAQWGFRAPSVFDACDGTNVTLRIVSTVTNKDGFCGATFRATRTWEAYDTCLNTSRCSQVVTVVDGMAPLLVCGLQKTVECGSSWSFDPPGVQDACDGTNVILQVLETNTNFACGKTLTARRSWSATDRCGNSTTCSQTVVVIDTTPPSFQCAANKVVECGASWNFDLPAVIDNCDGTNVSLQIVSTVTNRVGSCGNTYNATRVWEAVDSCTNRARCSQTVTVVDLTPPDLVCGPDLTVQCGTAWDFKAPVALDSCDGTNITITVTTTTNRTGSCGNTFKVTRVWRATDSCTNMATCSQTITIVDTVPPSLVCAPDLTVECGTAWNFRAPSAFDVCDGTNVTLRIASTITNRSGFCGSTFSATRTWEAADSCTNLARCSQTITVVDMTPPVLSGVPGACSFQCLSEVPAPPLVSATNNCDPNSTIRLASFTNGTCPLYITNIWIAIDACSNSSMALQVIRVKDTIPPILVGVPANQTNGCLSQVLPPPSVRAIDNCNTNVAVSFTSSTNGFRPTLIVNCWTAMDRCSNTTSVCQTNTVLDTPAAIGDFVWEDINHNGVQDSGEPGIANVTVRLLNCSNSVLAVTTTDATGHYLFTNLLCGSYMVQFVNPDTNLYVFTLPFQGVDTASDSDANQTTGRNPCIPLAAGETNRTIDAGVILIACNLAVSKTACVLDVPGSETNCVTTFSDADCVRVKYIYVISNTGDSAVNNVSVFDDQLGAVPGSPIATLAPGQFVTLFATNNSVCCSSTNTVTVTANGRCLATASAGVKVMKCQPLQSCTVPYPFASANPRTSVPFNESEVLRAFTVLTTSNNCAPLQIRAFYSDEHALVLGVRQVVIKTASGWTTNDFPLTPLGSNPGSAFNPQVGSTNLSGDLAGTDVSDRPLYPALFITDITSDPDSLAGDWQFGGQAIPPHAVFGTWKGAVRTIDKTRSPAVMTVQPDADPAKNSWNLDGGDAPPPGLVSQGYGAEVRWDVDKLGLLPGRSYRLYFMVHDGDQNKAGGDVGHGCAILKAGQAGLCTPAGAIGDFVWSDLNTNGLQDAGEPGVPGVTVRLWDCASNLLYTTTTDTNGLYLFTGLPSGNYQVQFVAPANMGFTLQNAGDGALDSNPDPTNGFAECIALGVGQTNLTADAGLIALPPENDVSAIGDFVWNDFNQNGRQDTGEPGIGNVSVQLLDCATHVLASTTTDGNGKYLFNSLLAGNYQVRFFAPAGYVFSPQNVGSDDLNSDAASANGLTVCVTLPGGQTNRNVDAGLYQPLPPTVMLVKQANEPFITPGGQVIYSYTVSNLTSTPLTGVIVSDDNGTPGFTNDDVVVGTIGSLGPFASVTLSMTNSPPTPMCMLVGGTNLVVGTLTTQVLPDGNTKVTYLQSRKVVDNTYGSGAVDWPNGHTFNNLLGSDKAEFAFYNGAGTKVLDFDVDYVSASAAYPSGYGTLGVNGGQGRMNTGNASNVVSTTTTITHALNQGSAFYGYTVNSPLPESSFPNWDYVDGYEVVVRGSAFGLTGFGHVEVPLVHNSPSKLGFNAVTPTPCSFCVTNIAVVTAQAAGQTVSASAQAVVCIATNRLSSVGDLVWSDRNGNGVQDAGEPGVGSVTVNLMDCSGHLLRSMTTDNNGLYLFSALAPGNYRLQFIAPSGASFTTVNAGANDATDSDADGATGLASCVSLGAGEINRSVDAGLIMPPASVVVVNGPRIYWPEFLLNGQVQLRTDGPIGTTYDIEGSSDLVHWGLVARLVNLNGVLDFTDPIATKSPQRFYRVVLAP